MALQEQLEEVFRQVFNDENLQLTDTMTSYDIPGWDSVIHINLMFGIEQTFGVRFKGNELTEMKNIGELKQFLMTKGQV